MKSGGLIDESDAAGTSHMAVASSRGTARLGTSFITSPQASPPNSCLLCRTTAHTPHADSCTAGELSSLRLGELH